MVVFNINDQVYMLSAERKFSTLETEEEDQDSDLNFSVEEMVLRSDSNSAINANYKGGKYDSKSKVPGNCPYNRIIFIFVVALLFGIGYFVSNMGSYIGSGEERGILQENPLSIKHKDRASTYNVRVLPASLSDDDLHLLPKDSFSYLAMIDAGSSGCRVHVYRYGKLGSLHGPLYILPNHISKKIKPGLSSFSSNPEGAGLSLQGLVDFIKEQVPVEDHATTPIWLKATAGLRMLPEQNKENIIASVRTFLGNKANSPFVFRPSYASVIPGNEEGGFGWIAYNYLRKVIGPKRLTGVDAPAPYAVVEMGGASTQVSQLARTAEEIAQVPDKYRFDFTIEDQSYVLYTYSYLGFGAEQAREGLNRYLSSSSQTKVVSPIALSGSSGVTIKDTCLNVGYDRKEGEQRKNGAYGGPEGNFLVSGASTGATCSTSVQSLFQPADGVSDKCDQDGPYSFRCIYQPDFVRNAHNFLVFENFYYVAAAVGFDAVDKQPLSDNNNKEKKGSAFPLLTSPAQMKLAAETVCGLSYSELNSNYPKDSSPKDDNIKWCFGASYSAAFLANGLHLDESKAITVQQKVDNSDVEWALGAAYKEAADFLKITNLRPT